MKQRKNDETADLEQTIEQVRGQTQTPTTADRHNFVRGTALSVLLVVLIVGICLGTWWFFDYTKDDGLIYPNVFVFGQDLGGLTPDEAAVVLREATANTFTVKNMTVNLPNATLTLTPADSGVEVDVDGLVKLAYDHGREGSRWANTQAKAAAALTTCELDPQSCVVLDEDTIRQAVDRAAAAAASTLTQTSFTITGETPDLNLTYEQALELTDVAHKQLTIVKGTPDRKLNTEALMEAIRNAYYANDFTPIDFAYDVVEPDALDLEALYTQSFLAPVDAVLNETDYTITPEVLGYGFDLEALKQQLEAAGEGQTVTISFAYVPAALTEAAIDATLFQDVLSSVSTNHTWETNRNTNLRLACQAINGKILRPGETFSYNETLGERTSEKGYKSAGAFAGGKSVNSIGGGICQVSSTLYYACLKADLEIVDRTEHGFAVSYVPYGMDATVNWGTLDYKFRNNTDSPIRIEASMSDGQVHVKLVGTDNKDYYVKMTYETVAGPFEGGVVYEDYPYNNSEGYHDGDVIQTSFTGRTVKSYRVKYDKATDEVISSTYEDTSDYSSRDKIVARVAPPPTEPPADADNEA